MSANGWRNKLNIGLDGKKNISVEINNAIYASANGWMEKQTVRLHSVRISDKYEFEKGWNFQ